MIKLKCKTENSVKLTAMTPFQGELKKRTDQELNDLGQTLQNDGLLMPFALWQHADILNILDGHGRFEALQRLAFADPSILEQEFPVVLIEAETEEEARNALLQITSTYGKFNKRAVKAFAATVTNCSAPVFVKMQSIAVKTSAVKVVKDDRVRITLKVDRDKAAKLMELLKKTEGVEVV